MDADFLASKHSAKALLRRRLNRRWKMWTKVEPRLDIPTGVTYIGGMLSRPGTHIRNLIFTYAEFRELTELSKKEADNWVKDGVIRAEMMPNQKRRYRFDSVVEGIIARQLADFSSRMLLPNMMDGLRRFLRSKKIDLLKFHYDPNVPRVLVRLYTRYSGELTAGGGVRGVVTVVGEFDPESKAVGKSVFLVVDISGVFLEALSRVASLVSR
jgi:hypothetical protein